MEAGQLAFESLSLLLGGLTKWATGLETWISNDNARINSCETAKAVVGTAADAAGFSSYEACADLAIELGQESRPRRRCASDRPGILARARGFAIRTQGFVRGQPDLGSAAAHRCEPG